MRRKKPTDEHGARARRLRRFCRPGQRWGVPVREDEAEIQQAQRDSTHHCITRSSRLGDLGFTPAEPKKRADLPIQNGYHAWIQDPRRKGRKWISFGGCWWTLEGRPDTFPRWRVSWIEGTGELYAAEAHSDHSLLLGVFPTREAVDTALDGRPNAARWATASPPLSSSGHAGWKPEQPVLTGLGERIHKNTPWRSLDILPSGRAPPKLGDPRWREKSSYDTKPYYNCVNNYWAHNYI